jgi:hypothetical protein
VRHIRLPESAPARAGQPLRDRGGPAVRKPGENEYVPLALDVLRIAEGKVIDIATFDGSLFDALGLPVALPEVGNREAARRTNVALQVRRNFTLRPLYASPTTWGSTNSSASAQWDSLPTASPVWVLPACLEPHHWKADERSIVLDGRENFASVFKRETDFRDSIARKPEYLDFGSAITVCPDEYAPLCQDRRGGASGSATPGITDGVVGRPYVGVIATRQLKPAGQQWIFARERPYLGERLEGILARDLVRLRLTSAEGRHQGRQPRC